MEEFHRFLKDSPGFFHSLRIFKPLSKALKEGGFDFKVHYILGVLVIGRTIFEKYFLVRRKIPKIID